MTDRVLQIAYLLLPFGFLSVGILHIGQRYAFLITALVVIALQIKNLFLKGFLIYVSGCTLFLLIKAINDPSYAEASGFSFTMVLFFTASSILYLAVINSRLKTESYYNLICIGAIIQSVIALCQFFGFYPIYDFLNANIQMKFKSGGVFLGTLGNSGFLAAYVAISLPFFFRIKKPYYKPSWLWFVPIIVFVLFISKATASVIPAIIGTMVFLNNKWIYACGTILCVGYGYYDGIIKKFTNGSSRFDFWLDAINNLNSSSKIIFGNGKAWGQFPLHNEWLAILYQYGIVGLSLIIGFVLTVFRGNRRLFSAFVIACVNMLGNYPLHLAPSVFLIIIIVGLMQREGEVAHA